MGHEFMGMDEDKYKLEPVATEEAMSETAKAFANIEAARRMARGHMELSKTLVAAPIAETKSAEVKQENDAIMYLTSIIRGSGPQKS